MSAVSSRRWLVFGVFVLFAVIGVALSIYLDDSAPPSHPESDAVVEAHPLVEWIWSGAMTTNSAVVKARLPATVTARLAVQDAPEMDAPRFFDGVRMADEQGIAEFVLRGLEADTQYYYTLELDGQLDRVVEGGLRTFGVGAYSFTVVVGACARTGSNGAVFDTIRSHDPNFFLNLGDLHYENIARNDPARFHDAYNRVMTAPAQALLYRAQPIVYVWDDHDFGPNNSSGASPAAEAARQAYGDAVPHYPLQQAVGGGIYQAFSVGRVRFIITDARSQRDAKQDTLLGAEQKTWLKEQLLSAHEEYALIVWANSVPWIVEESDFFVIRADNWSGYPGERREIADFLTEHGINNLVMLSGDAHMLALDDGSNTNYATDATGPGFPLFHVAALDREGSTKGGPYTEVPLPGGGQFGLVRVTDTGGKLSVTLTGHDYLDNQLLGMTFEVDDAGISDLAVLE